MAKINQIEIGGSTYDLQDKSFFTGTTAEVTAAIAAGTIKEGDIVNITDDSGAFSSSILDSYEEIMANTSPGKVAGALAVKQIASELGEDTSGMTVHEKLDYIMNNGSFGDNNKNLIKVGNIAGNSTFTIDMKTTLPSNYDSLMASNFYTKNSIINFNASEVGSFAGKSKSADFTTTFTYDSSTGILTVTPAYSDFQLADVRMSIRTTSEIWCAY